jgi:hypothetical protein
LKTELGVEQRMGQEEGVEKRKREKRDKWRKKTIRLKWLVFLCEDK